MHFQRNRRTRRKDRTILVIIVIIIIIFGVNWWGTRGDQSHSVSNTGGIPKTHETRVEKPTHNDSQTERHRSIVPKGHVKDVPGDDNNPKKG